MQIVNRLAQRMARESFERHRAELLEELENAAIVGSDSHLLRQWAAGAAPATRR